MNRTKASERSQKQPRSAQYWPSGSHGIDHDTIRRAAHSILLKHLKQDLAEEKPDPGWILFNQLYREIMLQFTSWPSFRLSKEACYQILLHDQCTQKIFQRVRGTNISRAYKFHYAGSLSSE